MRATSRQDGGAGDLDAVRTYWDAHVHDWKIARHPVGSLAFFEETEAYRFEKLHYLPQRVDFSGHAGKRVLDVGCGLGNDLSRFARGGAEVVGIDLSEKAVALSRENFAQRGLQGEFHVMNGEALDFPDASFDLVYCHTVLHFTPDPERMVCEIHRVLRDGGEAILMTINRHSWLFAMHRLMKIEIDYLDAPVFHTFTAGEFGKLLAPFPRRRLITERFPVRTLVHKGLKARAFNTFFVDPFNALPRRLTRSLGYHLLAFVKK
jgi:SAM-dependent methyltransferase